MALYDRGIQRDTCSGSTKARGEEAFLTLNIDLIHQKHRNYGSTYVHVYGGAGWLSSTVGTT